MRLIDAEAALERVKPYEPSDEMLHTEPYANARGYKGEAVCVEMNSFCSYGERRKSNENHT